jgi:pyruvate kinase
MLSAETAVGQYPVECVETMARIAARADEAFDFVRWAETVAHLRQHAAQAPREVITDAMTMGPAASRPSSTRPPSSASPAAATRCAPRRASGRRRRSSA